MPPPYPPLIPPSQVLGLAVAIGDSWIPEIRDALVAVLSVYAPLTSSLAVFYVSYWVTALAVAGALGLSLHVGWTFRRGRVSPILCVRALRVLVSFLVKSLYVTATKMLLTPVTCGEPVSCAPGVWIPHLVVSVTLLALFVPYAFMLALVNVDTSPRSPGLEARPHGYADLGYNVMEAGLVLTVQFASGSPAAAHALLFLLLGAHAAALVLLQPYYRPRVNAYRSGLAASASFFGLASLCLGFVRAADEDGEAGHGHVAKLAASVAAVALLPAAYYLGYRLSLLRLRRLVARHRRPEAGAGAGAGADCTEAMLTGRSGEDAEAEEAAARDAAHAAAPRFLTDTDVEVSNPAPPPRPAPPRLPGPACPAPLPPGAGSGLQSNPPARQATRFLRDSKAPTARELDEAARIFAQGMRQFPDSSFVQLCYAQFVIAYRGDVPAGLLELKRAWGKEPRVDVRFRLSSLRREYEQANRSATLGEGHMNFVQVLEFKKLYGEAQTHHNESIGLLRRFWKKLAKMSQLSAAALGQVPSQLDEISRAKAAAAAAYTILAKKFPNSKALLRSYGAFLADIANQADAAAVHFQRADEIEEREAAEARGAKAGGAGGGGGTGAGAGGSDNLSSSLGTSSAGESSKASSAQAAARKKRLAKTELQLARREAAAVTRLYYGIVLGLLAVVAISVVTYLVITGLFDSYYDCIQRSRAIARVRKLVADVLFFARGMQQAVEYDGGAKATAEARKALQDAVEGMMDRARGLYLPYLTEIPSSSDAAVVRNWDKVLYPMYMFYYTTEFGERWVRKELNVWDSLNELALGAMKLGESAAKATAAPYQNLTSSISAQPSGRYLAPNDFNRYRYIMRNGPASIMEGTWQLVLAYNDEVSRLSSDSKAKLGALVGVLVGLLAFLALGVFRPAFRQVAKTSRGVTDIISNLPRVYLKQIARKYAKARRADADFSSQDEGEGEGEGEGEDSSSDDGKKKKGRKAKARMAKGGGGEGGRPRRRAGRAPRGEAAGQSSDREGQTDDSASKAGAKGRAGASGSEGSGADAELERRRSPGSAGSGEADGDGDGVEEIAWEALVLDPEGTEGKGGAAGGALSRAESTLCHDNLEKLQAQLASTSVSGSSAASEADRVLGVAAGAGGVHVLSLPLDLDAPSPPAAAATNVQSPPAAVASDILVGEAVDFDTDVFGRTFASAGADAGPAAGLDAARARRASIGGSLPPAPPPPPPKTTMTTAATKGAAALQASGSGSRSERRRNSDSERRVSMPRRPRITVYGSVGGDGDGGGGAGGGPAAIPEIEHVRKGHRWRGGKGGRDAEDSDADASGREGRAAGPKKKPAPARPARRQAFLSHASAALRNSFISRVFPDALGLGAGAAGAATATAAAEEDEEGAGADPRLALNTSANAAGAGAAGAGAEPAGRAPPAPASTGWFGLRRRRAGKKDAGEQKEGGNPPKEGGKPKAKGEAGGEEENATARLLRALQTKYLLAFFLIAGISAANFGLCYTFIDRGSSYGTEITWSAKERALVRELVFYANELMHGDGVAGGRSPVLALFAARLEELRAVEYGLRFGNASMGLPGDSTRYPARSRILYQAPCVWDSATGVSREGCTPAEISEGAYYDFGVTTILQFFMEKCQDVYEEFRCSVEDCGRAPAGGAFSTTDVSPEAFDASRRVDPARIAARTKVLDELINSRLDSSLVSELDAFVDEALSSNALVGAVEASVLAFVVAFLALLYLLLFRPMVRRLRAESGRVAHLLELVPADVVRAVPYLHQYYTNAADLAP
eukprot:tig00020557_g11131.t1